MTLIDTLKQALDALDETVMHLHPAYKQNAAITALRLQIEALESVEPVLYGFQYDCDRSSVVDANYTSKQDAEDSWAVLADSGKVVGLFTHPAPQAEKAAILDSETIRLANVAMHEAPAHRSQDWAEAAYRVCKVVAGVAPQAEKQERKPKEVCPTCVHLNAPVGSNRCYLCRERYGSFYESKEVA
jgi:hypothetical protein